MNPLLEILAGGLLGGLKSVLRLTLIVAPLLVIMEVAGHYRALDRLVGWAAPAVRFLRLPREAAMPLLVAALFGIYSGAALMADAVRQGYLRRRDIAVLSVFISICHGLPEDLLLFGAVGANPVIMLAVRVLSAAVAARLAAYRWDRSVHLR